MANSWFDVLSPRAMECRDMCNCAINCTSRLDKFRALCQKLTPCDDPFALSRALMMALDFACIAENLADMVADEIVRTDDWSDRSQLTWNILKNYVDDLSDVGIRTTLLLRLLRARQDDVLVWTMRTLSNDPIEYRRSFLRGEIQLPLTRLVESPNHVISSGAMNTIVASLREASEGEAFSFITTGICESLLRQFARLHHEGNQSCRTIANIINTSGWLASCGQRCVQALVDTGFVKVVLPFLATPNECYEEAWMFTNWLLSENAGRRQFVKSNGLCLLLQALSAKPASKGAIFSTRKLAISEELKQRLIDANVLPLLVDIYGSLNGTNQENQRKRFAVALSMAFILTDPCKPSPAATDANRVINDTIATLPVDQDFHLIYTSLTDHHSLVCNSSLIGQQFGLWWIATLLAAQRNGFTKHVNYASMVINTQGLLPR